MKINKSSIFTISAFFLLIIIENTRAETIIMSKCDAKQDEFLKNEYILNLDKLIMIRNYVYNEKTFQKYKITDLSVKKSNSYIRNIYEENGKIFTHKHGYPQFYTQILFEKGKQEIYIKTVLNDEVGVSKISTCEKIAQFDQES